MLSDNHSYVTVSLLTETLVAYIGVVNVKYSDQPLICKSGMAPTSEKKDKIKDSRAE